MTAFRWLLAVFRPLAAPWVEVEGAEFLHEVPDPALFVLNHNNTFECAVVPPVLMGLRQGRPIHFLVDWAVLQVPITGWLIRASGPIPVYTKRARFGFWEERRAEGRGHSPIAAALERLAAGSSVGLFPEGTRNGRSDALLRPRKGLGRLVLRSQVPVVPIGIRFRQGRQGRVARIGRARLRIGRPLTFAEERRLVAGSGPESALERDLASRVAREVMAELARLSTKTEFLPRTIAPNRPMPGAEPSFSKEELPCAETRSP